jgi:hypothetical protein
MSKPYFLAQFRSWEYSAEQWSEWLNVESGTRAKCRRALLDCKAGVEKRFLKSEFRILKVQVVE